MGLVFRGMLGVTVSQILSYHSIVTVKMEEKQLKPWRCSWTKKITRHFPIVLKWAKKYSRPHFLTLGYY